MTTFQYRAHRRARLLRLYRIGHTIGRTLRTLAAIALTAWLAIEAHGWVAYWHQNPPVWP